MSDLPLFLIPEPNLGRIEDVYPEKITQSSNEWVDVSREVLRRRREAAAKGQWKPTMPLSDDAHRDLHPFGAQYCPALQEVHQQGFLLKFPATAIVRRVKTDKKKEAWHVKPSRNMNFYKYHYMTSFSEMGEADAFSIDTGWAILTPPGWSCLVKAIPNNLRELPGGLQLSEGIIRTDQCVFGLQVHAKIPEHAPDEFQIKRGDPMLMLFPFQREELNLVIMNDDASVAQTQEIVEQGKITADKTPGSYRRMYIDGFNPAPLYQDLEKRWEALKAAADVPDEPSE